MLILIITTVLAMLGIISIKETVIPAEKLPGAAKAYIEDSFPGIPISYAIKDTRKIITIYKAFLHDGTEIRFDAWGRCKKSG